MFLGEIMRLLLTLLLSALALTNASAQQAKRYIIGFKTQTASADRAAAVARLGGQEIDALDELGAVIAEVPANAKVQALSDDEMAGLSISFIEEDFYINWLKGVEPSFQSVTLPNWGQISAAIPGVAAKALPENPLPVGVDAAEVPWGIRRVNAPNAWAKTQGEGVRVAVIDTGIDGAHPDLAGQVAGGYNAIDKNASYFDDNSHGTHVSGTIAGKWDGKGVVGVAPKARLYAVKVLDKDGGGHLTAIIKGLVWCAQNNIQVANMSLGAPMGSVFMRLAVNYAASKGVTLVAAAGNSGGSVGYPGAYPAAIAISASDSQDHIAKFSSRGKEVAFIAPGVGVRSTVPNGGYDTYNGTSMATPHMTGLAALAVARGAHGPDAVRAALKRAASSIGLSKTEEGYGLVDAAKLVQ
jgi:subtilisin family serine protease